MFSRRNLLRGGLATAAAALPVSTAAQPSDKLAAVRAFADDLAVIDPKEMAAVVWARQEIAAELQAILRDARQ